MPNQAERPNILWICTDQQRWDTLGCYGNLFSKTPRIDRLAQEGTLFEHTYCQSPVCTPSRASFLTGRYPRTTRCRANGQNIPEDEQLVTRLLADEGYSCGLSGKLHLSVCNPSASPFTERRINDGYTTFHWSHHPAPLPYEGMSRDNWAANAYTQWLQEKGVTFRWKPFQSSRFVKESVAAEHHQSTWCADKAINFFETARHFGHPWLFSVNFFDPHHPFDPPTEYLERYLNKLDEIPLPNYVEGELEGKPIFQQIDHRGAYGNKAGFPYSEMTAHDHRLLRASYWAMCDLIDDQVGRMLDALEASGQRENTLVIFMSDHGEMLGDHGIYLKGPYFYEPAVRVPLIVSWPGVVAQGRRYSGLTELTDIAPTLLEAAGQEVPERMQGTSLMNVLRGEAEVCGRDNVYCEYYDAMPWHTDPAAQVTMLRNDTYKLVIAHSSNQGELYDLSEDPGETINRYNNLAYLSVKMNLLEQLCNRMAQTVDPAPPRLALW